MASFAQTYAAPAASPQFYYQITCSETARDYSTATYNVTLTAWMGSSTSTFGYYLDATIYLNTTSRTIRLKENSPSWSGTTKHTFNFDGMVATGLTGTGGNIAGRLVVTSNSSSSGKIDTGGDETVSVSEWNTAPPTPSDIGPDTGVYESSIPVSWSGVTDPNGDAVTYDVDYWDSSVQTWTHLYDGSSTSCTHNITGIARGATIMYAVRSIDSKGATSGYWAYSTGSVKRNSLPPRPLSIGPNGGIYESSVPVSWSSDADADGDVITYHVNCWNSSSNVWTNLYTGTANSCTHDITDITRNSNIMYSVKCVDIYGAESTTVYSAGVTVRNSLPSIPSSISPSSGYYESSIPVSWGASSDTNTGQSLSYEVYVSKNAGALSLAYSGSLTSFDYNIESDNRGTTYKFQVRAKDSLGAYSDYKIASGVCTKNYAPSLLGVVLVTSSHPEVSTVASWPAATDAGGGTLSYDVYLSKDGGSNYSLVSNGQTSTSYTVNVSSDSRNTRYKLKVYAKDGMVSSGNIYSDTFNKNNLPPTPTSISPTSGTYESTITVSWGCASDPDGGVLSYELEFKTTSNTTFTNIYTGGSKSYSHSITSIPRGDAIYYRVRCTDDFGVQSAWYTTSNIVYRNNLTTTPSIVAPINGSHLYGGSPRILITVGSDAELSPQTVYVSVDGTWYDSDTSPLLFGAASYVGAKVACGSNVIFCPATSLSNGSHYFEVKTHDGLTFSAVSSRVTLTIDSNATWVDSIGTSKEMEGEVFMKIEQLEELRTRANQVRNAYGISNFGFTDALLTHNDIIVKAVHADEIFTALKDVQLTINGWIPSNPFSVFQTGYISPIKNEIANREIVSMLRTNTCLI